MTQPILDVADLRVAFSDTLVVKGISFHVGPGETLGIIGESGSGKSVTALALAHLLPFNARCESRRFVFDGQDMRDAGASRVDAGRGTGWAMVFQDPTGAFNPVKRIGWHFDQVLKRAARARRPAAPPAALLTAVGIKSPERVLHSYPYQLSGGMLQRALIALVAALKPKLIIADEPTTNLDKVIENQILDLLTEIREQVGASVILITHDLLVAERACDRIAVMYDGELAECGDTRAVLAQPRHPYTRALLESSRSLARGDARLSEIPEELKERLRRRAGRLDAEIQT
ncbi:Oligopeptide transport system ATP-binding protein [Bordetella sputigena]|uniref:ABC transporter ATP-binding protein n=1 Tax=Bordetella sputigena TaxID=1416810 RepID=UPI0039EFF861